MSCTISKPLPAVKAEEAVRNAVIVEQAFSLLRLLQHPTGEAQGSVPG
jgi:hypothetical protein